MGYELFKRKYSCLDLESKFIPLRSVCWDYSSAYLISLSLPICLCSFFLSFFLYLFISLFLLPSRRLSFFSLLQHKCSFPSCLLLSARGYVYGCAPTLFPEQGPCPRVSSCSRWKRHGRSRAVLGSLLMRASERNRAHVLCLLEYFILLNPPPPWSSFIALLQGQPNRHRDHTVFLPIGPHDRQSTVVQTREKNSTRCCRFTKRFPDTECPCLRAGIKYISM